MDKLAKREMSRLESPWATWRELLSFPFADVSELFESRGMRIEELREGDTMVVRAEMPGLDPDKDVDITIEDGVLTIEARREERTEESTEGSYRSEFSYGSFTRRVHLPSGSSEKDVSATYTDGILEVRVPIRTEESHRIPVSRT